MANQYKGIKIPTIIYNVFIAAAVIACLVYGYYDNQKIINALKSNTVVGAKVIQVKREKIGRSYDIEFQFNGEPIHGNILIDQDGVNVGDSLLIRVSNASPREHFVFAELVKKKG